MGLRICIYNKFLGDADIANLGNYYSSVMNYQNINEYFFKLWMCLFCVRKNIGFSNYGVYVLSYLKTPHLL